MGNLLVCVDGASLNAMKRRLGLEQLDFHVLYTIVTNEIAESNKLVEAPTLTVPRNFSEGHIKYLKGAGFKTIPTDSYESGDDQVIIDRLKRVDLHEVSEIVLISADQDFVPALLPLVSQGVTVYWVATRMSHNGLSPPSIGKSLETHLGKEFIFVELDKFKTRLREKERNRSTSTLTKRRRVRVTVEADIKERHLVLVALSGLSKRFKTMTVQEE